MNAGLEKIFNELEKQRENIYFKIADLPSDQYSRSVNGKWSIGQILTHLMTSERLSLLYMKKKSLGIKNLNDSGSLEAFKTFLLKISQRLPLRFTAPKFLIAHTPSALDKEDLQLKWIRSRQELKNFLEKIEDQNVRKKIYKHPVAGRLDARQAMIFFYEHIRHHLPQIKRLL
jgi:hypothetical protein